MKRLYVLFTVSLLIINIACSLTGLSEQSKKQDYTATPIAELPNISPTVEPTATPQPTNTPKLATPTATSTTEPTPIPDKADQLSDTLPVEAKQTMAGEKIAFSFINGNNYDIYVMNTDGSNPVRLTDLPTNDEYATWSPDGQKIAFFAEQDRLLKIYVMNADGSNLIHLADSKDLGWSPDSKQIAFVSEHNGVGEINLINVDGSGLKRLTEGFSPAWSPDGQKIAFASVGKNPKLYVINIDGSNLKHLIDDAAGPAWSPNGEQIAFTSLYQSPPSKVYLISADGGHNLTRLVDGAGPVWSPDGRRIAFLGTNDLADIRYTSYFVINTDGTGQSEIMVGLPQMRNITPSWASDSQHVVLVTGRDGLGIDVVSADGRGAIDRLTTQPGFYAFPAWSPQLKGAETNTELIETPVEVTPDTPTPPKVYTLSLSEIANGSIANGYKSPPSGQIQLGNIPFNLPAGQNSITTQAEPLPDLPTLVKLPAEVSAPKQVNLLITGGNIFSRFSGQTIGLVRLYFARSKPFSIPLVAGQNIREWKLLDEQTVSKTSDPQVTEVWRTESNFGGTGIIDLLTIDLSDDYKSDKLVMVEIFDSSVHTVGSKDPAINLLGVTILGR